MKFRRLAPALCSLLLLCGCLSVDSDDVARKKLFGRDGGETPNRDVLPRPFEDRHVSSDDCDR